jgi:hypothetical protein
MTHVQRIGNETVNTMKTQLGFGVEIELESINKATMAACIIETLRGGESGHYSTPMGRSYGVKAPDGRVWFCKYDGSIGSGGCELVSPVLRYNDIPVIQEILRKLRRRGAQATPRCGVHVHVGIESMDFGGIKRFVQMVSKFEPLMRKALRIRSRRSFYCQSLNHRLRGIDAINSMAGLNQAVFGTDRVYTSTHTKDYPHSADRYQGCNLIPVFSIGTIEGRWFNGTTHAGMLRTYITLMLAMVAKAKVSRRGCSNPRFIPNGDDRGAMRMMLRNLGLKGEEFKVVRNNLTNHLSNGGDQ